MQPALQRRWYWLVTALVLSLPSHATETVHLLGFVESLCPDEAYCFELRVKPDFVATVGAHITVRFSEATNLYDPENYELTLAQQNIVPGSHLRLLIDPEASGSPNDYRASHIWIGD